MKKIVVDLSKCTGCGQCALTCGFVQTETFNIQQSNIRVVQWEDICLSVPMMCQQCHDAQCMEACPTEALSWDPILHIIRLDKDACTSCQSCKEACTFQVIHMTDEDYPMTCNQCEGEPACVRVCYPGALSYIEAVDEQFRVEAPVLIARTNGRNAPPPQDLIEQGDLSHASLKAVKEAKSRSIFGDDDWTLKK